jgi:hypothetical protein
MTCKPWQQAPKSVPFWYQEKFDPRTHTYYVLFSSVGSFLGFGAANMPPEIDPNGTSYSFWRIPYWSIVFPLTLLSAYMLLSNPRPAKKTNDTVSVTGESHA